MSIHSSVKDLIERSENQVSQNYRGTRISIYSRGLKSKFQHAEFALKQLEQSKENIGTVDTSDVEGLSPKAKVKFYNDCFWTFLHSSFDILAQVINQAEQLGVDESGVSFKGIQSMIANQHSSNPISQDLTQILNSDYYININNYRHCTSHRRPICLHFDINESGFTNEYTDATGPIVTETKIELCDDPDSIVNPSFSQQKKQSLTEYCARALSKSEEQVEGILNQLL